MSLTVTRSGSPPAKVSVRVLWRPPIPRPGAMPRRIRTLETVRVRVLCPSGTAAKRANLPEHADPTVASGHAMGSVPLARGSTERLSDGR
jgi:hypothetical protein